MKKNALSVSLRLLKFTKPFLPGMFFSISMGVAGHFSAIAVMTFSALFLCSVAGMGTIYSPGFFAVVILFFASVRGVLHYFEQYKGHDIAFRLLAKIRSDLFESLRHLAPAKLVERKSGDIVTSLTADIEIIEVFFAHTIAPVSIAFFMFIILVSFFSFIHPILGLIMALSYIAVAVVMPVMSFRYAESSGKMYRENISELNSFLIDSLQGMRELILFNKASEKIDEMEKRTASMQGTLKSLRTHEGVMAGMNGLFITLASSAVLIAGVVLVRNGTITTLEAVTGFITAASSFGPFAALSLLSNTVTNTFAAAGRIFAIQDEVPQVSDKADAVSMIEEFSPSVECSHLLFSYKNEVILKDLDLSVKPGSKIAIQGESGSGKTTLLRLLLRFWDADSGSIEIKKQEITDVTMASLRDNVRSMSQETYLFDGTIAENIALGKKNATENEIIEAARKSELHEFIETLPDGYNAAVGESGGKLSGGERQRIGIARTILGDSDIVLLDEMTSSLDILNEKAVLRTIRETMKDKTVITVTHRDTVAAESDIIFNIKKR